MNSCALRTQGRVAVAVLGLLAAVTHASSERPVDRVIHKSQPNEQTTEKIVGGNPADPGRYPFQVALIWSGIKVGNEYNGQFCGGSLISRRWVLTAAHCVPDTQGSEVDVVVGANLLGSKQGKILEGARIPVQRIFSHPKYDAGTHDFDLALLQLTTPAPKETQLAIVATKELESAHGADGKSVTVIGWGALQEDGAGSAELMEVTIDVQPRKLCAENYQAAVPRAEVTQNMWCAGTDEGGKDSCQGDSGGFIGAPLDAMRFVQLGIVSWGIGCARKDLFGVYTRVANFADWIATTQKDN